MTPNTIKHLGAKKIAFGMNPLNGAHSQTYHIKQDPNDDHIFVNQCILRLCRDKSSIDARKTRAQTNTKWSNCIVLPCTPHTHHHRLDPHQYRHHQTWNARAHKH
eukprot:553991_1